MDVIYAREIQKRLIQAIEEDASLDDRKRRALKRKLRWRPRLRQEVLDMITSESLSAGVLAFPSAQIDWDALLAFIKELIPIIVELIELFG